MSSVRNRGIGKTETFCKITDSLAGAENVQAQHLDALCSRYEIDNSKRTLHGALLDAQILADVYLMMTGGRSSRRSLWKAREQISARRPRRQPVTGGLCL
jgi:DNA polymerase III epsilon subunit-like protein